MNQKRKTRWWTARLRRAGVLVTVLVGVVALGTTIAFAQAGATVSPVGTWNQAVHLPQGDEQTMLSFNPAGTVTAIAPELQLPCPDGSGTCTLGSPSVGRWVSTGRTTFEYTIKEYVYDADGHLAFFVVPHAKVTLGADGSSFHANTTTGFWTASGTLLFTVPASSDGTRLEFPSY